MRKAASELRKTLAELNFDEELAAKLPPKRRLEYLGRILKPCYLSSGRHRYVYGINGGYVLKVPVDPVYTAINTSEWNIFRKRQKAGNKWVHLVEPAKCCIVMVAGSKLLMMERLERVHTPEDRHRPVPRNWPPWVSWVDCAQCGISTRTGKVVAFDYGSDRGLFP